MVKVRFRGWDMIEIIYLDRHVVPGYFTFQNHSIQYDRAYLKVHHDALLKVLHFVSDVLFSRFKTTED